MTFTSFFASVGRSHHGLTEGSALSSMVLSKNMKQLFSALYAVIFVTVFFELTGVALIYFQLPADAFSDNISRFTFSLFHSVSAFCNAGFSIAPNGMMNEVFDKAYGIQMTIAWLIIFGGLGFFIITNYMERFLLIVKNFFRHFLRKHEKQFQPNLVSINSRLVVTTTFWLLSFGTGLFMFFEWDGVLSGLGFGEKLATSFFCAVTPRTAGFNTLDYSTLAFPTIMLTILFMWIGASPGSTGGGIKTTTFAIAFLNAFSIGRGKNKVHFHNREISNMSIRKAFLMITFSIFFVFLSTMLLSWHEPGVAIHALLFEAFSAFGTVGLSMNLTPWLSDSSKYILIFLMFAGRIGVITLFVAFIRKTRFLMFSYPEEEVFI
jgi:Trk-type K+ transport system membrane component